MRKRRKITTMDTQERYFQNSLGHPSLPTALFFLADPRALIRSISRGIACCSAACLLQVPFCRITAITCRSHGWGTHWPRAEKPPNRSSVPEPPPRCAQPSHCETWGRLSPPQPPLTLFHLALHASIPLISTRTPAW